MVRLHNPRSRIAGGLFATALFASLAYAQEEVTGTPAEEEGGNDHVIWHSESSFICIGLGAACSSVSLCIVP